MTTNHPAPEARTMTNDPQRCRNWIDYPGMQGRTQQCHRARNPEKGDGKYCNICHAAKVRGARASSARAAKRKARRDSVNRLTEARDRVLTAASAWRKGTGENELDHELTDAVDDFEYEKTDPDKAAVG